MAHLNVRIRVEEDHTEEVLARLQQAIGEGIGKAAAGVAALGAKRAPRVTGELARSIEPMQAGPVTWLIVAKAPYAHIVHNGSRKVPARPFLLSSLLDYRGQIAPRIHEAWRALGG